ncbi:hypothetical protein Ancab_035699 [Ancistrocladus abbreviatus]
MLSLEGHFCPIGTSPRALGFCNGQLQDSADLPKAANILDRTDYFPSCCGGFGKLNRKLSEGAAQQDLVVQFRNIEKLIRGWRSYLLFGLWTTVPENSEPLELGAGMSEQYVRTSRLSGASGYIGLLCTVVYLFNFLPRKVRGCLALLFILDRDNAKTVLRKAVALYYVKSKTDGYLSCRA